MQEGVSHESCSYAGHLGLGKLIALYDDNNITIDGADPDFSRDDRAQNVVVAKVLLNICTHSHPLATSETGLAKVQYLYIGTFVR